MMSLPQDLARRCRQALLECDKFDSDETLKSVFSVEKLAPFQHAIPHSHSREDRVDKVTRFLLHKKRREGQPIFLDFLRSLCVYIAPEDNLYGELEQVCIDVEYVYFSQGILDNPNNGDAPLALAEKEHLLEVTQSLLKLKHMRDKHLLEDVLKLLPGEIVQSTPIDGQIFSFKDILHVVQTCLRYPDGLEKLAYALYQKESDSPHWQTLDALLRKISKKTVTYTRLQQLQSILATIPCSEKVLSKAYKLSIPDGWIELSTANTIDSLPSILEKLAVAPLQSDGTFPIMVFAQYLAQKYQELPVYNDLTLWIRERSQELGLSTAQMGLLCNKASSYCTPTAYYLLITLDPENESSFYMRAWLLDSEGDTISNAGIEVEHESVSFEQVPAVMDLLLEKCGDYLADEINKLTIEVVLPNELLCYPVDHWLIDTGMEAEAVKLGIQHKVTVRSLERLRQRRIQPLWKSKWKELQKLLDGNTELADHQDSVWICDKDLYGTYESLFAMLRRSPTVCLALAFAPLENVANSSSHVLKAMIGAGIPIALWPRKLTNSPKTAHDLFTSFLSPETLFQIPTLVWEQRLAAGQSCDEHHQGHHLTLLWDDPNRLPPTAHAMQFAMPSTRRGV
ncbi:MAG: hypothetical protein JO031_13635 [Ktedonobacteraceae bacterium]|nr:hypothetical protein [Ktedonobacteraceae bacterium]